MKGLKVYLHDLPRKLLSSAVAMVKTVDTAIDLAIEVLSAVTANGAPCWLIRYQLSFYRYSVKECKSETNRIRVRWIARAIHLATWIAAGVVAAYDPEIVFNVIFQLSALLKL